MYFQPPRRFPPRRLNCVSHQRAPKLNCQFPRQLTARNLPEARGCSPAPARINFLVGRSTAVPLTRLPHTWRATSTLGAGFPRHMGPTTVSRSRNKRFGHVRGLFQTPQNPALSHFTGLVDSVDSGHGCRQCRRLCRLCRLWQVSGTGVTGTAPARHRRIRQQKRSRRILGSCSWPWPPSGSKRVETGPTWRHVTSRESPTSAGMKPASGIQSPWSTSRTAWQNGPRPGLAVSRMAQEPPPRTRGAEKKASECHFILSFSIRPDPASSGLRARASARSPM